MTVGFCTSRKIVNHAASHGYTAKQIGELYNFPKPTGPLPAVALIELGGGYKDSDISAYCFKLGVRVPNVVAVSVDGATNDPTDPQGADGEVALDIQCVIGATLGYAPIKVFFAPNTSLGFINAILAAARDPQICAIGISWGSPEDQWTAADVEGMEAAFTLCKANGIAVFAASGDNGSSDGEIGNHTDYPASSPLVVGCGGTTINNPTPLSEMAWSYGGGGYSSLFSVPSFQQAAMTALIESPGQITARLQAHAATPQGRGVPDIAGNADPSSGYYTIVHGQAQIIGGTSAVAPLWAGLASILCGLTGKRWGNLGEILYTLKPDPLHDITSGSNGSYKAARGWDACTGNGTPNGSALLAALQGLTPPAPQPNPEPIPMPTPIPPPVVTPPVGLGVLMVTSTLKPGAYNLTA